MMIYGFLIFYIFLERIKYCPYKEYLTKTDSDGKKIANLYTTHIVASGLISNLW